MYLQYLYDVTELQYITQNVVILISAIVTEILFNSALIKLIIIILLINKQLVNNEYPTFQTNTDSYEKSSNLIQSRVKH